MTRDPPSAPAPTIEELLRMDSFALTAKRAGDGWSRRRIIGLVLGVAALLAICLPAAPVGLTVAAQRSAGVFALALVWWVTEPVPTHVTSLVLMVLLVLLGASEATPVLAVFGLDVIWLNVLAFILSAMLVKTHLAKRLALWLVRHFGARAIWALGAFVVLQLVLAPLIPATAARAAITLPLMIAMAGIYGSTAEHPTNFGRNLFLLNLTAISILSSTVMTGSAANLMAVGFIQEMTGHRVYYTDWLVASAPVAILTVLGAWLLGPRIIFRLRPEERTPRVAGGMQAVAEAQHEMGKMTPREWRAIAIFGIVIVLWVTDRWQAQWFGFEMGAPIAAMIGAVLALTPGIGLLDWEDTAIPWHLMIFSAGAYAGGLTLESSGAAAWGVERLFAAFDLSGLRFGYTYALVTGVMIYSHLLSTSKTVRTVIMVPSIILLARGLGWDPFALALPAAFAIDWVVGLPISGKPNVILYGTNQYTARENLRYGLAVCTVGYALLLLAGATYFRWLGITPSFAALP